MSIRERIADFISGGALTDARQAHAQAHSRSEMWAAKAFTAQTALLQIIAADTPNGNGTVKRMVRMARKGLW
jgi:hypothetical protein